MAGFYRTNLGRVALQQRNIALNAKQRRLLLLIDHGDFQSLNSEFKKRIAPPEIIQQLIDLELIAPISSPEPSGYEEITFIKSAINNAEENREKSKNSSKDFSNQLVGEILLSQQNNLDESCTPYNQPVIPSQPLSFEEIRQLMMKTLSSYCGLMTNCKNHVFPLKNLQQLYIQLTIQFSFFNKVYKILNNLLFN